MSCIRCDISQHTLTVYKCTPSLQEIKASLMIRNFWAHQAEAMSHFVIANQYEVVDMKKL